MLQILLNSVDITSAVSQSIRINHRLGAGTDTADFGLLDTHGILPAFGDEVVINEDGTKEFAGTVVKVSDEPLAGPDGLVLSVTCQDFTPGIDRLLVSKTYSNQTVDDIIADMVSTYAPTYTAQVDSTFLIQKVVFNQRPMSDCIQSLADSLNYDWLVDNDKVVRFFPRFYESADFDLTEGNAIPLTLSRTEDGSQVANRVKVRGGEYDGSTYTDTITVSGSATKSFKLPKKFANLSVTLNTGGGAVAQDVGIEFLDDFTTKDVLYNYQESYLVWESALPAGAVITYSGNPKTPVFIVSEDSESIAKYGVREKLVTDNTITSNELARRRALAELYNCSEPVVDAKVRTYRAGLTPGMSVRLTLCGHDDTLMVKQVTAKLRDHTSLMYDVSLVSAKRYGFLDLMRKALSGDPKPADESEQSEQVYADTATMTITEEITQVQPTAADETMTITEELDIDPFGAGTNATYVLAPYVPRLAKITIDHEKIPSDLTDFQFYARLSDMEEVFWNAVADGGGDIRVHTANLVPNGYIDRAPTFVAAQTATNYIDGTATGSATDNSSKWRMFISRAGDGTNYVMFDDTVHRVGGRSLKCHVGAGADIYLLSNGVPTTSTGNETDRVPLIPGHTYRVRVWLKTANVSGTTNKAGFWSRFYRNKADGTNNTSVSIVPGLKSNIDWTLFEATFTANATDAWGMMALGHQSYTDQTFTGDAYWDGIEVVDLGGIQHGEEIAREVVSCDTATKTGELWVKVPAVSSSVDTVIFIAYGTGEADYAPTDTYGSQAVWGADAKYVGHFEGDADDSSATGLDGTLTGTTSDTGKLGGGLNLNGTSDYVTLPYATSPIGVVDKVTYSAWVKMDLSQNQNIFYRANNAALYPRVYVTTAGVITFQLRVLEDSETRSRNTPIGTVTTDQFYLITCEYEATASSGYTLRIYVNGELKASGTWAVNNGTLGTSNYNAFLGYDSNLVYRFKGVMDEVRILLNAQSSDVYAAEYANQSDPATFYSVDCDSNVLDPKRPGRLDISFTLY